MFLLNLHPTPTPTHPYPPLSQTVAANVGHVPPVGKGSLYLRPLLLGTGPILGLGPAPSYTLVVYCAAVGSYFKGGQLTPIDLVVETRFHRAAPGGMGGTKAAGNYSPVLVTQLAAKQGGYSDVVYLDAKTDTYLEEVSSCNIFVVSGRTIRTPPLQVRAAPSAALRCVACCLPESESARLRTPPCTAPHQPAHVCTQHPASARLARPPAPPPQGTILPGVTRRSIIELARARGFTVEEVPVTVEDALAADEVFTTGTAVVVSPVGSLTYQGRRVQYGTPGQPGPVALELYDQLTGLQTEKYADPFGWVYPVC